MLRDWLSRVRQGRLSVVRRSRRAAPGTVSAQLQALEPRVLLTASPVGSEIPVNTFTTDGQQLNLGNSIASDADGDFVLTWTSYGQDGDGHGIFAQRYNAAGQAEGGEFQVNSHTADAQNRAGVAMDADGNFVITWDSYGQDGSLWGIYAQRYNALGIAQGDEFQVNSFTTGTQYNAAVAMDASGDFVVTWSSDGQDGSSYGIFAQRYNAAGLAQGSEFRVNSYTTSLQEQSTVAIDAAGDFVVTWVSDGQDGNGYGIFAQRYNADGVAQGLEFQVNTTTTGFQGSAAVAMDADGDFVIAWQDGRPKGEVTSIEGDISGIFAQRYNADGIAEGLEFQVNTTTTDAQILPGLAIDADGDFVVTWTSFNQDGASTGVYSQQFNDVGVQQGGEVLVNTFTTGAQSLASVAMDADGDYVVAWTSYDQIAGPDVFVQRFYEDGPDAADDAGPIVTDVMVASVSPDPVFGDTVYPGESLVAPLPAVIVQFSEELPFAGGTGGANSVTNPGNWRLTKNGVDASALISGISIAFKGATGSEALVTFTAPLSAGDYVLTATSAITDLAGNALDGDRDGTPGGDFIQNLLVRTPQVQGAEFRVNTYTTGQQLTYTQSPQAVATDANGNFVVTWTSDSPIFFRFIYAQRYNANGIAQGSEFLVHGDLSSSQQYSTVAMDADGNFVITWTSYSGNADIYARRYNAAGVAQGAAFLVNTTTTNQQRHSTVAMDADGDFVITWSSLGQDGDSNGVYGQRYNEAGIAQGGEFLINSYTTGTQSSPTVAMSATGEFVVTWSGQGVGEIGGGVFGQRFDAQGIAQGSAFLVNTYTTLNQSSSAVAMDASGDFVVTWSSFDQDGSTYGVFAQRFDKEGVAQGAEFQVNTFTTDHQRASTVAMDADGDFVITWTSDLQAGRYSVYAQRYSAAGVALGNEFRVNTYTSGNQKWSSVAMDADGDFVVVWTSNQDGSGYGIYAQRYAGGVTPTDITLSANTITENQPSGTAIGTFSTTDADSPEAFMYGFISGAGDTNNASFQIVGNELRSNTSFNFEGQQAYSVRVQVTDSAGLTFDNVFTINVTNVNEAPTMNGGMVTIAENRPNGAVIGTFTGTDPDAADSLTYSITAGNTGNAFAINPSTGQITVNSSAAVNFELNPSFTLTLQVTDAGMLSDTDTVTITLSDLNEQPYAFGKSFTFAENRPAGYVLGNITTGDPDAGQALTYSITGGNTGNAFAIDAMTGQLTVNSVVAINFETNPTFMLQITATDNGSPAQSRVGTAAITVTNLNEQPYAFSKSFTLSENRPAGYVLGNVTTGDPDAGQTLSYSITGGNTGNAFAINAMTGQLTVNSSAAVNFEANPSFILQITATDNSSPAQSRVGTAAITVTNLNEQPYAFSKSFTLSENRPAGYVLGNITTGDPDASQTLTYSITGGNTGHAFAIHATTGQLTVNSVAAVNFETNPSFTLQITATDNGSPAQSRVGTAAITVTDLNEAPTFLAPTTFTIDENSTNGTVVGTVVTVDPEGQPRTYSFTGGNTNNAFAINAVTGQITVNDQAALDFDTTPQFLLSVKAEDNGSPANSRTQTITINLNNVMAASHIASRAAARSVTAASAGTTSQQNLATASTTALTPKRVRPETGLGLYAFTLYEPLAKPSLRTDK